MFYTKYGCYLLTIFLTMAANARVAEHANSEQTKSSAPNSQMLLLDAPICSLASNSFERTTASANTKSVYFVNLRDNDKVISPFRVVFGLSGMGIAPAGVKMENTGHHHLLIDQPLSTDMLTKPIPFNKHHSHFGKGQTESIVELPVGKHKLRLLFADGDHKPFYVYSKEISIEVVKAGAVGSATPN